MSRRDSRGPGRHNIVPGITRDRDLAIAVLLRFSRPVPPRPGGRHERKAA